MVEDVACMEVTDVQSSTLMKVIAKSMGACIQSEEEFRKAAQLLHLASAFQRYDVKRVRDETAHGAFKVLMSQITREISQTKRQKFFAEVKALKNSERLVTNCSHLREIGPPTYTPVYMVRHGMDAVLESMEGEEETTYEPPEGFDAENAWAAAMDYADCSDEAANPSDEAAN